MRQIRPGHDGRRYIGMTVKSSALYWDEDFEVSACKFGKEDGLWRNVSGIPLLSSASASF